MTDATNVSDLFVRKNDSVVHFKVHLVADRFRHYFPATGLIGGMNPLPDSFNWWWACLRFKTQHSIALFRIICGVGCGAPGKTARFTQSLRFRQKSFTAPQGFLSPLALDPLRDRVGNRCERVENGFRKWATREQRHHSNQPILDNQRVSGEGNHSVTLCPTLIMHAWIVHNVIGEM